MREGLTESQTVGMPVSSMANRSQAKAGKGTGQGISFQSADPRTHKVPLLRGMS